MRERLQRMLPLGLDPMQEVRWVARGLLLSAVVSLRFLFAYTGAYRALFRTVGRRRVLIPGAVMPPFGQLVGWSFAGFLLLAAAMAVLAVWHWLYHYQDSRSIYLMRRLRNRRELWRRCLAMPALGAAASLLAAGLLLLMDYGIYRIATPEACLQVGGWLAAGIG